MEAKSFKVATNRFVLAEVQERCSNSEKNGVRAANWVDFDVLKYLEFGKKQHKHSNNSWCRLVYQVDINSKKLAKCVP